MFRYYCHGMSTDWFWFSRSCACAGGWCTGDVSGHDKRGGGGAVRSKGKQNCILHFFHQTPHYIPLRGVFAFGLWLSWYLKFSFQPNLTPSSIYNVHSVWPFSRLSQHLAPNQTSLVYKPQFGRSPVSLNTLLSTKPHSCTNLSLAVLPSLSTPCSQPNLTRVQTSVWPFAHLSQHLAPNQTSLVYKPQFGRSPVSLNTLLPTKPHSCTNLSLAVRPSLSTPCSQPNLTRVQTSVWRLSRLSQHLALNQTSRMYKPQFGRSPVSLNTLLSTKPHSCTNLSLAVLLSLSTPYSQPNLTRVQTSVWPFSRLSQHLALNQTSLVYKPQFGRSPVSLNTLLSTKPHSCTNLSLAVLPSLSTPCSQPNLTRVQTSVWPFSRLSQHLALNQTSLVYKPQFGRSPVSLNTLLSTKPHSCTNLSLAVLPSLSTSCSQPSLTRVHRSPVSLNILLSTKPHSCTNISWAALISPLSTPCSQPNLTRVQTSVWPFSRLSQHLAPNQTVYTPQRANWARRFEGALEMWESWWGVLE